MLSFKMKVTANQSESVVRIFTKRKDQYKLDMLSERAKLRLLLLLLLLMLGFLAFTTATTLQAAQNFQQQYSAVKTEDVNAIHPWMSIHVISHIPCSRRLPVQLAQHQQYSDTPSCHAL